MIRVSMMIVSMMMRMMLSMMMKMMLMMMWIMMMLSMMMRMMWIMMMKMMLMMMWIMMMMCIGAFLVAEGGGEEGEGGGRGDTLHRGKSCGLKVLFGFSLCGSRDPHAILVDQGVGRGRITD